MLFPLFVLMPYNPSPILTEVECRGVVRHRAAPTSVVKPSGFQLL